MSREQAFQPIPRTLPLRRSVNADLSLVGVVTAAGMDRLASAVLSAGDNLEVRLEFGRAEMGKPGGRLSVRGKVEMECQRCLQPVQLEIESEATLLFVAHDEEARAVSGDVEPVIVSDDVLDVYTLVEDEVLLALPTVALHADKHCE